MLRSRIVIIRGTYDTYTRRELNEKSSKIRGIYTRVSTIAFRRNADGISSFRSRRVAWRERKQLREGARRRKLAVLLASRRGADRWREGRKKFSACSSLGEEVDRGGWMEKEEGISRRKFWKRHSCGRCSSSGGNLFGNLEFEGVACRRMFWDCCLFIYLIGERLVGLNHFEMMNKMGKRITRNYVLIRIE